MHMLKTLLQRVRNHSFILKNSLWLIISEIMTKGVLFVVVILLARYLGAEGYGRLQFALSFAGIFALVMDLGFNALSVREIARDKNNYGRYVSNVCFVKLCLFAASIIILIVSLLSLGKSSDVVILSAMACVYYLFASFVEFFKSVFQAFEKMRLQAFSRLFYGALLFVVLGLLMLRKGGVAAIMGGYLFAMFATFAFTLLLLLKAIGPFSFKVDGAFMKALVVAAVPFMMIYIAAIINFRIDIVMLSFLLDDSAVGLYSVAFNIFVALGFIPSFCCAAVYPSLNRFFKSSARKLLVMFKSVFWLMLVIGAVGSAGLFLFSKPVLSLLFGPEFSASAPVLQIMALSFFVSFGVLFMGYACLAIDRQFFYAKVIGFSVVINIMMNYFFIGRFGISGAAMATVVSQSLQFIILAFFLARRGFFFLSAVPAEPKLR